MLAAPVMAQEQAVSGAGPVTLVQAGRLLDRPGQAPRGPSTVVVRDGRIVEIRDGFVDAAAFPGATVIDQRERFVMPGLIDSHVHLVSDLGGQAGFLSGVTENLPTHAYRAAENAQKTLMAGFTTVRNLGDEGGVTLALADETAAHRLPGPRIIDSGNSISTTSGHMDGRLGFNDDFRETIPHDNVCNGVESCRNNRCMPGTPMQCDDGVSCTVDRDTNLMAAVDELRASGHVTVRARQCLVCVVAAGLLSDPTVCPRIFAALGRAGVPVKLLSMGASAVNVGLVVDDAQGELAVRVLHREFFPGALA
jgi:imidazolonepropionase-like amidohydrolase